MASVGSEDRSSKRTQRQFLRFAVVGAVSNLGLYVVYLLLTAASLRPPVAVTITYALGVLLSFIFNRNWTFSHRGPRSSALLRYWLVYASAYVVNVMLLLLLVDRMSYPHELVQAAIIGILAVVLFVVQKVWVFKEPDDV